MPSQDRTARGADDPTNDISNEVVSQALGTNMVDVAYKEQRGESKHKLAVQKMKPTASLMDRSKAAAWNRNREATESGRERCMGTNTRTIARNGLEIADTVHGTGSSYSKA
jgi:hypothetical protein